MDLGELMYVRHLEEYLLLWFENGLSVYPMDVCVLWKLGLSCGHVERY